MRLHRCACWSAPLFFSTLNWTNPFPVLGLLGAIIQSQESLSLYTARPSFRVLLAGVLCTLQVAG